MTVAKVQGRRLLLDPGDPDSCGEAAQARRAAVSSDDKFRALMLAAGHKPHVVVTASTNHPRFTPSRGLPMSNNASPAAQCADYGGALGKFF